METTKTAKLEEHMKDQNHKASSGCIQPEESQNGGSKPKGLSNSLQKGTKSYPNYNQIALPVESINKFPLEWWKTGIALLYVTFCLFLMSVIVVVANERVPPKEVSPPLPDRFFDYFDYVGWTFNISEISVVILIGLWTIQCLFLKYKSIVGRRYFFIVGTVALYRCTTLFVTTLSVPEVHLQCAPKLNGNFKAKVQRLWQLIYHGGFVINGAPPLCGDYLFSGHVLFLTITYLFIKEYSTCRFWWYHLICRLLWAAGIFCLLTSRAHYTVDVIVGYYISTRLFWWYHAMANEKNLKVSSFMSRVWWFPIFSFLERNVQGPVPCSFLWPISQPTTYFMPLCQKHPQVQRLGEDNEKPPEEN